MIVLRNTVLMHKVEIKEYNIGVCNVYRKK